MKIIYTDDFLENLEKILKTNPKLSNKITNIISNIKKYGFGLENFTYYNLKKINNNYFRLKIIPYRIIIKNDGYTIVFDNIFKRKGKTDYKKYS